MLESALTDATGLMQSHNQEDAAATLLTTATGVDTGVDIAAVSTFALYRVEMQIDSTGLIVKMVSFKDKVQIGSIADALAEDVAVAPVCYIGSKTTSVEAINIKRFATWALAA